jgi:hypothetical protein
MSTLNRRKALALGAGTVGALAAGAGPASAASWVLKWNPSVSGDGLRAFEGLEDDRADSHPGVQHIYTEGDHWRFDMHTVDVDTSPDRQRNEAKGMRDGNTVFKILQNQTWRIYYQAYWPSSLTATTKFTHLFQMKVQDVGAPLWTLTPRAKSEPTLTITGDAGASTDLANYSSLQNKWIDVQWEFKASHSGGYLSCVLKNGSSTVASYRTTSVDLWRDINYLRPKWGVYRSLESDGLKNCYQLIRGYKGYQLQ